MPKVLNGERLSREIHDLGYSEECLRLYDQVNKRIWWMPWRQQAMKDVVVCDKPRRADKRALTRGFPNGATHGFGHTFN